MRAAGLVVTLCGVAALMAEPVAARRESGKSVQGVLDKHEEPSTVCEYGAWSSWSPCAHANSAVGIQTRSRKLLSGNATVCKFTEDWQECEREECEGPDCFGPNDCTVSPWTEWSNCSQTCGGGEQTRQRSVTKLAVKDGAPCPALKQSRKCNTKHCPIDCQLGDWGEWGNCTAECAGGVQFRRRPVMVFPDFGGEECGVQEQNQTCNTHTCPVDCQVGTWGEWSSCSVECNGWGHQNRTREVVIATEGNGTACPDLYEERNCTNGPCPIDCSVTEWGPWTQCDAACDGGQQSRSRHIQQRALFGGKACPPLKQKRACNNDPCPNECVVGNWTEWSECSEWCGDGVQIRLREIERMPREGFECPALNETRTCNLRECPQDCEVGNWTEWSLCSSKCGNGRSHRSRPILKPSRHGGSACPSTYQEKSCNNGGCAVDCALSLWSEWSDCSPECGPDAVQNRTRVVLQEEDFGGAPCPPAHELFEQRHCHVPCPGDCQVSEWETAEECSKECGTGEQRVTRKVVAAPSHGGKACPELEKVQKCNTFPCAGPLLDTNCSSARSCPVCLQQSGCGFSPSAGHCMPGDASGPEPLFTASPDYVKDLRAFFINLTNAVDWDWIRCREHPCADYQDMTTCARDARCGWCANNGGVCMPGDERGPSKGLSCPAQAFIRWPGYNTRQTSRLRKPDLIVPTREQSVAFGVEDKDQRDAVWKQATADFQAKHPGDSCTPCAGAFPHCDCSAIMQQVRIEM